MELRGPEPEVAAAVERLQDVAGLTPALRGELGSSVRDVRRERAAPCSNCGHIRRPPMESLLSAERVRQVRFSRSQGVFGAELLLWASTAKLRSAAHCCEGTTGAG